jgi:hypothetical protein
MQQMDKQMELLARKKVVQTHKAHNVSIEQAEQAATESKLREKEYRLEIHKLRNKLQRPNE